MELKVLSERQMTEFMGFDKPHAVISIRSVGAKGLKFIKNPNRKALMIVEFDDVVPQEYRDKTMHYLDEGKYQLFSDDDAKRIARFIKANKDVEFLLINCEAGISRSAAVSKAICMWDSKVSPVLRLSHNPNPYVYDLVLKELQK